MISSPLSPREFEVLRLLCAGMVRDRDLARALTISPYTVHFHMGSLMSKLECSTRAELIARAYVSGLVEVA